MNKSELIDALAGRLDGDKKRANETIDAFVDLVFRAVGKGEKVSIAGFGVFERRPRAARIARNPATGEPVKLKKTSVPAFRPGTKFKGVVGGQIKLGAAPRPAKSAAAKKTAATATKTAAARKTTATAAKSAPAKRTAASAAKSTAAKKTTGSAAKKATATTKTAAAKTAAAKKAPAKKSTASAAKKTTAAKKTPAKKSTARKAPAKK